MTWITVCVIFWNLGQYFGIQGKTIEIFGKLYYTNIIIINNNIEAFINILLKLVICYEYF